MTGCTEELHLLAKELLFVINKWLTVAVCLFYKTFLNLSQIYFECMKPWFTMILEQLNHCFLGLNVLLHHFKDIFFFTFYDKNVGSPLIVQSKVWVLRTTASVFACTFLTQLRLITRQCMWSCIVHFNLFSFIGVRL